MNEVRAKLQAAKPRNNNCERRKKNQPLHCYEHNLFLMTMVYVSSYSCRTLYPSIPSCVRRLVPSPKKYRFVAAHHENGITLNG